MKLIHLKRHIEEASKIVGNTWPLYSFVTSNPLSGYEQLPFSEAVDQAKQLLNARVYPNASIYRKAWEKGDIQKVELLPALKENGFEETPEFYLDQLESEKPTETKNDNHDLDRIMVKWLSAFMDEGLAEWEMPFKKSGFYAAWRQLIPYDAEIGKVKLKDIPKTSENALSEILSNYSEEEILKIFTHHLAALPGWTGYIKHRSAQQNERQEVYPIELKDYLAVRIWTAKQLNMEVLPTIVEKSSGSEITQLQHLWLTAWERSWQNRLIQLLDKESISTQKESFLNKTPDAQFVFCIDTRSELIRRHIESVGEYETFGYAGFFGIPMDYKSSKDGISHKSCPPIVDSSYSVTEIAQKNKGDQKKVQDKKNETRKFWNYFLKRMKNMLPSTFGFVEGSGVFYGAQLMLRTMAPASLYRISQRNNSIYESVCEPELHKSNGEEINIPKEEKAIIVKSAFELMGWKQFSPLVLFVGHGSHSANNPFGSSLDCGACAASPGRHNARMLAKLANDLEVRRILKEEYQIEIPEATFFLGAEHNTTTDEIVLFDSSLPESHQKRVLSLKRDLQTVQETATQERLGVNKSSVLHANTNASNWGETRPEWGLAKNASFIIAPRNATKAQALDGRSFLHSYDWETDKEGQILETIMQGPMVVTQWINNHYYFSTVDNDKFGGGTKVTHNITGKFGVVQGNGGDLKTGLPWESLYTSKDTPYHPPLRLSVVIKAPLKKVESILAKNENLKTLADNEWIYLIVMDPLEEGTFYRYKKGEGWSSTDNGKVTPKQKTLKRNIPEEVLV
ncbi:DUF2309 domain-containing protein [[Muricauda] lutisoli]|uniref:Probable inorganic carbon transporter subunit DabA n=1 Tax=[Muricauda] lutisoli TaxID=2816035 RepID=A0ABS3ESH5_9FLAO|nr:DUF2309 domain-containing protein [[Muricauda] lutisoli]MBO0329093.1 DUF2309 domain-containing protein [[Muricauda] lutisoli]